MKDIKYGPSCELIFSDSLIIHQVYTREIMTMTVVGYLIRKSMDFYDFISLFPP